GEEVVATFLVAEAQVESPFAAAELPQRVRSDQREWEWRQEEFGRRPMRRKKQSATAHEQTSRAPILPTSDYRYICRNKDVGKANSQ
ncbi:MAG TPA: hypothetical protein VEO92_05010, partial [Candidatus Nitrosocosmicus sp.]|nr:hypothetical protein [Candidatus Nitrosocosmicus sp.]